MSELPLSLLGNMSAQQFLSEYWQKKPLLVRKAVPEVASYCDPDQLAGLSLEENIESRLIIGSENDGANNWKLQKGPFDEKTFSQLPDKEWTLLVQAVNFYLPQFTELMNKFDFIPHWRVDDLMASFAAPGGSVGPHFDNYDVFLIQASGQRRWFVGETCDASTPLLKHPKLRLLKNFTQTDEWLLNPGDMLYLPPRMAHYGIAVDECMTFSVGYQAPSVAQISEYFCDDILEHNLTELRYSDPDLNTDKHPGILSTEAICKIKALLEQQLNDPEKLNRWVAQMISEPKYSDYTPLSGENLSLEEFSTALATNDQVCRDEASRFLYTADRQQPVTLYINGDLYEHPQSLSDIVIYLCDHRILENEQLTSLAPTEESLIWLNKLHSEGLIYFPDISAD